MTPTAVDLLVFTSTCSKTKHYTSVLGTPKLAFPSPSRLHLLNLISSVFFTIKTCFPLESRESKNVYITALPRATYVLTAVLCSSVFQRKAANSRAFTESYASLVLYVLLKEDGFDSLEKSFKM